MSFLLEGTGVLLGATLLLCALAWAVLWSWRRLRAGKSATTRRGGAARFWRRVLLVHLVLAPVHFFVTMPAVLGWGIAHLQTRRDEARYDGPRIDADGRWVMQSRASLRDEAAGAATVAPELRASQARHTVRFAAEDGVNLRAFLVAPRAGAPRCTVVLVHGLFRGGLELEPVAAMFRDLGAEALMLEMRNHGGSDRAPPGFGVNEQLDVVAAVRWLRARPGHASDRIVLFGVSLGTAAVALATRRLPDLAGVVLDAPVDDALATANRMLDDPSARRRGFALPSPLRELLFTAVEVWSGTRLADVHPAAALRELPPNVPVLLIGGGEDRRVPPDVVRELFAALPTRPELKQLWIRDGSDHGHVWADDPDGYRRHLSEFLATVER